MWRGRMVEWRLHSLLYGDESEENLTTMVRWFVEVCRRKGLKANDVKQM